MQTTELRIGRSEPRIVLSSNAEIQLDTLGVPTSVVVGAVQRWLRYSGGAHLMGVNTIIHSGLSITVKRRGGFRGNIRRSLVDRRWKGGIRSTGKMVSQVSATWVIIAVHPHSAHVGEPDHPRVSQPPSLTLDSAAPQTRRQRTLTSSVFISDAGRKSQVRAEEAVRELLSQLGFDVAGTSDE